MPPPLLNHVSAVSLPQHCDPSSPLLADVSSALSTCLPTPLALASSLLGSLSIVSWLFAQLPQIYKNYQLQSTSGLSFFFLAIWCLGDSSNLVGAVLTRQAGWQVVVAAYYVFVDVVLVFQFFWYTHVKRRRGGSGDSSTSNHGGPASALDGVSLFENDIPSNAPPAGTTRTSEPVDVKTGQGVYPNASSLGKSPPFPSEKYSSPRRSVTSASGSGPGPLLGPTRTVLLSSMLCAVLAHATSTEQPHVHPPGNPSRTTAETVGRVFSWMSALLYLGSRPPQLYKNYRRKSTAGLSPLLFTAAFCGNLFYSTSILTNPNAWSDFPPYGGGGWADAHGTNRLEWIGRTVPFFLGAFGVLGMDGFMGVQFLMYGGTSAEDTAAVVGDEDDDKDRDPAPDQTPTRWTHFRVWMGRWIPSVSPNPRRTSSSSSGITAPEGRALLGDAEQERYGAL